MGPIRNRNSGFGYLSPIFGTWKLRVRPLRPFLGGEVAELGPQEVLAGHTLRQASLTGGAVESSDPWRALCQIQTQFGWRLGTSKFLKLSHRLSCLQLAVGRRVQTCGKAVVWGPLAHVSAGFELNGRFALVTCLVMGKLTAETAKGGGYVRYAPFCKPEAASCLDPHH